MATYPEYSARYVAKRIHAKRKSDRGEEIDTYDIGEGIGQRPRDERPMYRMSIRDMLGLSAKVRGRRAYIQGLKR